MAYNRYKRKFRRARRGWRAGSRAIKLMKPELRRQLFGQTYMQRLADPSGGKEMTPEQRWMRKAMNYRGEGDYTTGQGDMVMAGPQYGLFNFGPTTGSRKTGVFSSIGGLLGLGDYGAPVTNQLIAGPAGVPDRITVNASDDLTGDIFMSHSEFVGNIEVTSNGNNTASSFESNQYYLNPGLAATFPFLSQIASNYEMYELLGTCFQYRPLYGEGAGSSNLLGKVIMATQYDPTAPSFVNSQTMQNYAYASSCKPSITMMHGVETANRQQFGNLQFIRTGPTSKNLIFTDIGFTQISTEGVIAPDNAPIGTKFPIGELWVSYRVKLSRAKLFTAIATQNDLFYGETDAGQAAWLKAAERKGPNNTGNFTITNSSVSAFTIGTVPQLQGYYKLSVTYLPAAAADAGPTAIALAATSGVTFMPFQPVGNINTVTQSQITRASGNAQSIATICYPNFTPQDAGSFITVNMTGGAGTDSSDWRIEFEPMSADAIANLINSA